MKSHRTSFTLGLLAQRILRGGLFLCLIHGIVLLGSVCVGYRSGSPLHFAHNVEGLKALLLSLSLTFLGTGLTERAAKSA